MAQNLWKTLILKLTFGVTRLLMASAAASPSPRGIFCLFDFNCQLKIIMAQKMSNNNKANVAQFPGIFSMDFQLK